MSNFKTSGNRMPHDLSHLGFLAGQFGRLITISTTPIIAGDSFEMDAFGGLRFFCLTCGLAFVFTVSSRRLHTRSLCDWSSDVFSFFFKQKTAYEITV